MSALLGCVVVEVGSLEAVVANRIDEMHVSSLSAAGTTHTPAPSVDVSRPLKHRAASSVPASFQAHTACHTRNAGGASANQCAAPVCFW